MKKKFIILFLILIFPLKVFALIEVDITRGNLNPLPLAVSPLAIDEQSRNCLLYTSPSPRDATLSRMPSSA